MESERSRPKLARLIDSEELSHKLEARLGEVVSHAEQRGFPRPVGAYHGTMLWDETDVDRWLDHDDL
jgi:predicted DNA-binding transcriptional regulator AlpA